LRTGDGGDGPEVELDDGGRESNACIGKTGWIGDDGLHDSDHGLGGVAKVEEEWENFEPSSKSQWAMDGGGLMAITLGG